ncbi:MAG: hypothetical protein ACFBSG_00795 [Leptolyngbyaceae cyanobacterium]
MRLLITAIATTIVLSSSVYAESARDTTSKIRFDLNQLDEFGLYGPEDGKRSLSYEFCVPNDLQAIETVQAIDPSIVIYLHSPGRVGCDKMEVLAIGETHQPNYRAVLIDLANLDSIERIEQFWGE